MIVKELEKEDPEFKKKMEKIEKKIELVKKEIKKAIEKDEALNLL